MLTPRQCYPLQYFLASAYFLTGVCFSTGCCVTKWATEFPHALTLTCPEYLLLTHTLILHNPNAACTQLPTHIDQPQQTHSQTFSKPSHGLPQTQLLEPITHISPPLLPPLLLFPAPPLYIPLELCRTSLLFLNFEFVQDIVRNTAALPQSH